MVLAMVSPTTAWVVKVILFKVLSFYHVLLHFFCYNFFMKKAEVLGLNESDFLKQLETSASGLTQQEAEKRLLKFGRNIIVKKTTNAFNTLFRQFKSSLVYLLVIASLISFLIKDYSD